MSDAPLHFLPWLRLGLAGQVGPVAVAGLAPGASASATVAAIAEGVTPSGAVDTRPLPEHEISLLGPGAVVGLDGAEVLRRSPAPGVADAETNYFAFVELRSPDLPWRYTPAQPDAAGRLQPWLALVVVEDRPGVWIEDRGPTRRPALHVDDANRELPPAAECWAWAHVQIDHDLAAGVTAAHTVAPGTFRARLLCPRRLAADRSWLACVVPTFEAGRRAGLDLGGTDEAGLAWGATDEATLPVYDWWRFSSGPNGDFESLVERLVPREIDAGVGVHDLDVGDAGAGLPVLPRGIVSFAGALTAPGAEVKVLPAQAAGQVAGALRDVIDAEPAAASAQRYDPRRDDPVVAPARYGGPQTGLRALPARNAEPVWFGELNTTPGHRAVAGIGTEVARVHQESFMDQAWDQAKGLTEVNRRLNRARLALEVGIRYAARVQALTDEQFVGHASSVLGQVVTGRRSTALRDYRRSSVATGLTSGAFRRLARPGSGIGTRLGLDRPATAVTAAFLADPDGHIAAYRVIVPPLGADVAPAESDDDAHADPVATRIDAALVAEMSAAGLVAAGTAAAVSVRTVTAGAVARPASGATLEAQARQLAGSPTLDTLVLERPVAQNWAAIPYSAPADTSWIDAARAAVDPAAVVLAATQADVVAPAAAWTEPLPAAMWAGPEFPQPTYELVRDLSVDLLVPGVRDVPDETLGLLETNDRYVEAFLVGINHEMSREFLWREYPAMLSGTWFRQFWNGVAPDIPAIAAFDGAGSLGSQDGSATPDLVLLIKGTFPLRYPDVRVYAVEAHWTSTAPAVRDEDVAGGVRVPILAGQLAPDTVFYGFELDEATARGSTSPPNHPGWFFVLEERPKGPRFGLDVGARADRGGVPPAWSELSWAHVSPGDGSGRATFLDLSAAAHLGGLTLEGNGGTDTWGSDAAAMARITLQRPVRLLVHADAMLPEAQ